ncbi:MAG: XRE family transcriptional regulator, partial [Lactobacillus gasseri]|nr:XRE family transcriptional regulator [Lactobacillus gasseri]
IPDKPTVTEADLDEMLDNARSFDGKPMDDHDRALIRAYLKGLYDNK